MAGSAGAAIGVATPIWRCEPWYEPAESLNYPIPDFVESWRTVCEIVATLRSMDDDDFEHGLTGYDEYVMKSEPRFFEDYEWKAELVRQVTKTARYDRQNDRRGAVAHSKREN